MAATTSMGKALESATDILAESSSFQSRCGAADADAAANYIGWDTLADNEGLHDRRPFAIVKVTARGSNQVSEGIAVDLVAGGGVLVYLCDNARANLDHSESYLDFLEFVGGVIDDMEADSGVSDAFPFHTAELILPPQRTPRSERTPDNDYWETAFLLQYGDRD